MNWFRLAQFFDYEGTYMRYVAWAFGMDAGLDMFAAGMGRKISEETVEPVMLSFYEYSKGLTAADMFMAEFRLEQIPTNIWKILRKI